MAPGVCRGSGTPETSGCTLQGRDIGFAKLLVLSCEVPLGFSPSGLEWSPGRNPQGAGSLVRYVDFVRGAILLHAPWPWLTRSSLGRAHALLCLPMCLPLKDILLVGAGFVHGR